MTGFCSSNPWQSTTILKMMFPFGRWSIPTKIMVVRKPTYKIGGWTSFRDILYLEPVKITLCWLQFGPSLLETWSKIKVEDRQVPNVVSNVFILPLPGENDPIWRAYFSIGLKLPPSICIWVYVYEYMYLHIMDPHISRLSISLSIFRSCPSCSDPKSWKVGGGHAVMGYRDMDILYLIFI